MKKVLLFILLSLYLHCAGQSFFTAPSGAGLSETAIEVGTVFTTSANGKITGLRFYKWKNDAGLYTLKLYANSAIAATATYSSTATGWVTVNIPPVQIVPGITYTTSYYSPGGFYQGVNPYPFPIKVSTLTATKSVYKYGSLSSTIPSTTFQTASYFADVVYSQDPIATIIHDTIRIHDTVMIPALCPDTTWIYLDGSDSSLQNSYPDFRNFGIFEFTLPYNKHVRFFREVQLYWRRQEQQPDGSWIEK